MEKRERGRFLFFNRPKCEFCKETIWFWHDAMHYLLAFDTKTGKQTTTPAHWDCGLSHKFSKCFGRRMDFRERNLYGLD